jgi:tetratricopeptide (TPR) repeat protein
MSFPGFRCIAPSLAAVMAAAVLVLAPTTAAVAADKKAAAEPQGPQMDLSKGFRKAAGPVQKLVTEQKWDEVLAALPALEALPDLTPDDRRIIFTWRMQANKGKGDQDGLAATYEAYLASGLPAPELLPQLNQVLAAHYNGKKDVPKTIQFYQRYVELTPNPTGAEYETLGRLNLQVKDFGAAAGWLTKAIDSANAKGTPPLETWYQLRDRCYLELQDKEKRLANLEELTKRFPKREYYSRVIALYAQATSEDRIVLIHILRLASIDQGLASVGEYLNYADTAMIIGSPGEAQRSLEKGMAEGIVPKAGSNQQVLQEAKNNVALDRKSLPNDEKNAAKNPKGEVDVKIGLGYYSLGDTAKAVEAVKRGLAKGGVKRVDDANMLLGAALVGQGNLADAKAAFAAAAAAPGANAYVARTAALWTAYVDRLAAGAAKPAG